MKDFEGLVEDLRQVEIGLNQSEQEEAKSE